MPLMGKYSLHSFSSFPSQSPSNSAVLPFLYYPLPIPSPHSGLLYPHLQSALLDQLIFCHGPIEAELTARLRSPVFAATVAAVSRRELSAAPASAPPPAGWEARADSAAVFLSRWSVEAVRRLESRLFLASEAEGAAAAGGMDVTRPECREVGRRAACA
jgi:hypothetical protein